MTRRRGARERLNSQPPPDHPTDLAKVFVTLARWVDQHIAAETGWRCVHAIPRIDGTAYFMLRRGGTTLRIDWRGPDRWGQEAWSAGHLELDASAGQIQAEQADALLDRVTRAVHEWLPNSASDLVRFSNPTEAQGLYTTARSLFVQDRVGWDSWLASAVEEREEGHIALGFSGAAGTLTLTLGPPDAEQAAGAERVLSNERFSMFVLDDARSPADRGILAHQVERLVGFCLNRALPAWLDNDPEPRQETEAVIGPSPPPNGEKTSDTEEGPESEEFYLYLSKCVCNANCLFCSRASPERKRTIEQELLGFDYQAELEAIRQTLNRRKIRRLFRVGGHEPTIYPTLFPILEAAVEAGYHPVGVDTNGIALADADLVRALAAVGVTEVRLPVYGVSEAVHEAITGVAGSMDKTRQALANLADAGIRAVVGSVAMRQNFEELDELLTVYPEISIRFVMPISGVPGDYERVCPRLSDMSRRVLSRLGHLYLPCIFPHREVAPREQADSGYAILSDGKAVYQGDLENMSREQRLQLTVKADKCESCGQRAVCTGIYQMYIQVHGTDEFEPF